MSSLEDVAKAAGKKLATGAASAAFGLAIFGAGAVALPAQPANAMTKAELNQLSYLQVKGTGLANRCADVSGDDVIRVSNKAGTQNRIVNMCIEPTQFASK